MFKISNLYKRENIKLKDKYITLCYVFAMEHIFHSSLGYLEALFPHYTYVTET